MDNRTKALMCATLAVATLASVPNAMAADVSASADEAGVSARDSKQDAVAAAQERVDKAEQARRDAQAALDKGPA